MRQLISLLIASFFISCVPVSIAPNIKDYEVVKMKRFKRDLPSNYGFVFEDPKEADEFYNFIQAKFNNNASGLESNIAIQVDDQNYYLSFYERERVTKTVNIIPVAIDAKRESNGNDPLLEEAHTSRTGQWYLLLTVTDDQPKDMLKPDAPKREQIITYLRALKSEYLSTQNYMETYLKGGQQN